MNIESSKQIPPPQKNSESFPHNKADYGLFFVGMSIGNLIGDELFDTGFTPISAAPRAAIATGLLFGAKKAWQCIKN